MVAYSFEIGALPLVASRGKVRADVVVGNTVVSDIDDLGEDPDYVILMRRLFLIIKELPIGRASEVELHAWWSYSNSLLILRFRGKEIVR